MYTVNHISDKLFILYMLYTFQLQTLLLMPSSALTALTMASKPSTNTTTSTTTEKDLMPPPQSIAHAKKELDVTVTSSTPNPAPTSVTDVTDAVQIISATPAYRRIFIAEVFRKCNEIAQWEKDSGKTSPELPRSPSTSRKLPNYAFYQNYSDGKLIPAG